MIAEPKGSGKGLSTSGSARCSSTGRLPDTHREPHRSYYFPPKPCSSFLFPKSVTSASICPDTSQSLTLPPPSLSQPIGKTRAHDFQLPPLPRLTPSFIPCPWPWSEPSFPHPSPAGLPTSWVARSTSKMPKETIRNYKLDHNIYCFKSTFHCP